MLPEFDRFADTYSELLRDPFRDAFSGGADFFAQRKWGVLTQYLDKTGLRAREAAWLDVGCGQGDLLRIGGASFRKAAGCDVSREMLAACGDMQVVLQSEQTRIPFPDRSFDLLTAVCVYHHVPLAERPALSLEIARVLRPGGTACIIEHNPYNPVTQYIVRRTPVDVDAHLLTARKAARLLKEAGLKGHSTRYFLYVPQPLHARFRALEDALSRIPAGGQYAVFAQKPSQP